MNLQKLNGHLPQHVIAQIPDTVSKFNINTTLRLAHFLSQCHHESGGFKLVTENLNYSAKSLTSVFKKYFPDNGKALLYERKPEKIANLVYSNRMGNGSESSGDGYKYRGRGYIQLTGKSNYEAFDKFVNENILETPDLIATKYPLLSAAWFFQRCLPKCDAGSNEVAVTAVTKCVNGGSIGLEDRKKHFSIYFSLLTT